MGPDLALAIFGEHTLDPLGLHGIHHWGRVAENGIRLASHTGANQKVVVCFALFHDLKRSNESLDPAHGARAAQSVRLVKSRLKLTADEVSLVLEACSGHSNKVRHSDPTIGTCWDSDRMDLARIGIRPDRSYLSTSPPKPLFDWAVRRARRAAKAPFMEELFGRYLSIASREKYEPRRSRHLESR